MFFGNSVQAWKYHSFGATDCVFCYFNLDTLSSDNLCVNTVNNLLLNSSLVLFINFLKGIFIISSNENFQRDYSKECLDRFQRSLSNYVDAFEEGNDISKAVHSFFFKKKKTILYE